MKPQIGQPITVHGVACEIIAVHPAGTIDAASIDPGSRQAWRITGLSWNETDTETIPTETQARAMTICPACGRGKTYQALVCWNCFKYRQDITPLKYSGLSFRDWLRTVTIHKP